MEDSLANDQSLDGGFKPCFTKVKKIVEACWETCGRNGVPMSMVVRTFDKPRALTCLTILSQNKTPPGEEAGTRHSWLLPFRQLCRRRASLDSLLDLFKSPGPYIIDVTINRNPLRNERVLADAPDVVNHACSRILERQPIDATAGG